MKITFTKNDLMKIITEYVEENGFEGEVTNKGFILTSYQGEVISEYQLEVDINPEKEKQLKKCTQL